MKKTRAGLSARYLAALRFHLTSKSPGNGDRARQLGRAAVSAGLATLDLAIMHEKAVLALGPSGDSATSRRDGFRRRSFFLTHALRPFEAAQRVARETNRHLQQRNATLRRHTAALARGNRRLEREVARREAGERAVRKGQQQYRILFLDSQRMQKKLRHLTRQIILAQEEERKEISRELHDEVVQTLVGINVALSALSSGASSSLHTLSAKIARAQRLVTNSVNAVHRFARELRPAVLDDLGLIPALHAYSKNLAARKNLKIQLTAFAGVESLRSTARTVLYRVAQEALTNVVRHARATCILITIAPIGSLIRMEIGDNGRSFEVHKTLGAGNPKRLGLIGMKERIEMIGGRFTIESMPGHGTTVRADVPFHLEKIKK